MHLRKGEGEGRSSFAPSAHECTLIATWLAHCAFLCLRSEKRLHSVDEEMREDHLEEAGWTVRSNHTRDNPSMAERPV
eukprot:3143358-Pleurochrysis_carterae.AAC.1